MLFATKQRKLITILFIVFTVFFGYTLSKTTFSHNLDDFFDKKEPVFQFNKQFFSQFKKDTSQQAMIGIKSKTKLNYAFFLKLDSITSQLERIENVTNVYSISNQKLALFSSLGTIPYSVLRLENDSLFNQTYRELGTLPDIKSKFISDNEFSTLIYLSLNDTSGIEEIKTLKNKIDSVLEPYSFKETHFINDDFTSYLITEKLKKDSLRLVLISLGLIILILIYFFQSVVGVIIPFIIIISSVVWVMGTISLFNISLNVLTIAIPVIVGVISLSDVIHIISRYSEEKTGDKFQKIIATKKDILRAIILTTVTTSVGFLTLSSSNIPVFIEFSIFTAVGVIYAFIIAYFMLPVLLFYTKKITLNKTLNKITPKKITPKITSIISVILIVICVLGILKVKNNNYMYEDINANDKASHSFAFMENEFYGIRELKVTISLQDSNKTIYDYTVIQEINQLEEFIEKEYNATIEMGIATRLKQFNRARNGGDSEFYILPKDEKEYRKTRNKVLKFGKKIQLNSLVSANKKATYIGAKTKDNGSYETRKLNKKLRKFVAENLPNISINLAGVTFIIDETNVHVTQAMIFSLLGIIIFIMILISLIFKSLLVGIVSLLPNILPLLAITSVVGWFDLGMNIATTIVYTIAFGIAVDDTIHFLSRYKIEREKPISNHQAIINTMRTSGGAILLTTLILVFGFGVLIFSDFYANFITGLLVCVGLVVALICDLYLLPVMLLWVKKD